MATFLICKNVNFLNKNFSCFFEIRDLLLKPQHLNSCFLNRSKFTSSTNNLDITFTDTVEAYRSKKLIDLIRTYLVLKVTSYKFIVNNNDQLIKIGNKLLGKTIFTWLIKKTFYKQFVAGEDEHKIKPTIEHLKSFGVKSILDYSAEEDVSEDQANRADEEQNVEHKVDLFFNKVDDNETKKFKPYKDFSYAKKFKPSARVYFYQNESECEKNMKIFFKCIDAVAGSTKNTGFAAVKLTALGRPQLLLQLSEVIKKTRIFLKEITGLKQSELSKVSINDLQEKLNKNFHLKTDDSEVKKWFQTMDYDKEGLMNLFSWNGLVDMQKMLNEVFRVLNIKTGKIENVISYLTLEEEEMFRNMMRRIHQIAEHAKQADVRIMIDAEQSYFQLAINRITMELMRKYNKEKAIIFNTYQCYQKNAYENILIDLELAKRQNFFFGAKLVRGAYMVQERIRAKERNYEDPINDTFEGTNEMYHKCLTEFMNRMVESNEKKISIMVATHNEDSVRFTVKKMKELGIDPAQKLICFGQLYGMSDHISFPLGQAGYSVYKYLPYGPVDKVIPYLSRRAIENHGILEKIDKEKKLLKTEISRRLIRGQVFHKPVGVYAPV